MISRETVTRYTAGDGSKHDTLEAAQKADLTVLISDQVAENLQSGAILPEHVNVFVAVLVLEAKRVVDLLTTTPTSLTKARKIWGGKKTRKAKVVAEQFKLPGTSDGAQSSVA